MDSNQFIAHIRDESGASQSVKEHLLNTMKRARHSGQASCVKDISDIAEVIGLLHDMGKYTDAFQKRIRGDKRKVNHSTAGAQIAIDKYGKQLGGLMAYCICGHHGGMPDSHDPSGGSSGLTDRLEDTSNHEQYQAALKVFNSEITLPPISKTPKLGRTSHVGYALTMMVRMLFSMLVDADFLDTEEFCQPDTAAMRSQWPDIQTVYSCFFSYMQANFPNHKTEGVNAWRGKVYQYCLDAAHLPKGIFTLTVPTGGGKTLSSMAFALEHARLNNMRRVIYAIPYTSIIEQNADVFKRAAGNDAVLEHHSNFKFKENEDEDGHGNSNLHRLACENWEAPVVVTTNVQFFESLFANRPSRCRKLHNIANSVIILDEAQMIPDEYLTPCLAALQCLQRDYGCTIVICTATQPAFGSAWPDSQRTTEIIKDTQSLFNALKRVSVSYIGTLGHEALADRISSHKQTLCIVNTRGAARNIFTILPEGEGNFHLSTLMCAQHRTEILDAIRVRLRDGACCRVVSTQLVEAGVDIDFPVVYRAAAGIDSIAQAAGRCNREGKQTQGFVYVFNPEEGIPKGWLGHTAALGLSLFDEVDDVLSQEAVRRYFTQRYNDGGIGALDRKDILAQLDAGSNGNIPFAEVSSKFRFIESQTEQIIIPYDDLCQAILAEAETSKYPAKYMRRLQRYMLGVYKQDYDALAQKGYISRGCLPCAVLTCSAEDYPKLYSTHSGLNVSPDMATLMA